MGVGDGDSFETSFSGGPCHGGDKMLFVFVPKRFGDEGPEDPRCRV